MPAGRQYHPPLAMKPVPLDFVRPEVMELAPDIGSRPDVPIHLDWNESRWPLPPDLLAGMAEATATADSRPYPDGGYPAVREAIGALADWDPEGVVFGNGGDDMLQLSGMALTGPGRVAIYPSPGFSMYPWAIRLAGADPRPVPLGENLAYDVAALERRIVAERPSLVLLTNPHNPTGELLPLDAVRRLAEVTPGFLLLDEAYHEFAAWNARSLLDEFGNLLLLRTFSKAMAMAGARLGYLLARPEAAHAMRRAQPPFPVGVYTCRAAAVAMRRRDLLMDLTRRITAERSWLADQLKGVETVEAWPSQTNFLLFRTPMHSPVLRRRLIGHGVSLRDFSAHPRLAGTLRVTVGTRQENRVFLRGLRDALSTPVDEAEIAAVAGPDSPIG